VANNAEFAALLSLPLTSVLEVETFRCKSNLCCDWSLLEKVEPAAMTLSGTPPLLRWKLMYNYSNV